MSEIAVAGVGPSKEALRTIPRFKQFDESDRPVMKDVRTAIQLYEWKTVPSQRLREADLVVVGGGLSGVAAALAARRRGLSVVIVEATHMLGGQATAAGVSAFDITFHYDRSLNDHGIWSEIVRRVIAIYDDELRRPVNVGHYRNISLTPNVVVVERVLTELVKEAKITALRNTSVKGVLMDGPTILGVETSAGEVRARVVIDATEDGSLLALAGVPHRISNGISNGRLVWGVTSPTRAIQDITWTATIQKYPDGVPESLRVLDPPADYEKFRSEFLDGYPSPGQLDPKKRKAGPLGFAGFRAAPDLSSGNMQVGANYLGVTRTNLNHMNDHPVTLEFLTDPSQREKFEAEAKLRTISIIYYLQNELGLPWSVCTDEGFADGPSLIHNALIPDKYRAIECQMPIIPYIREGRRVIGSETITIRDLKRQPNRTEAAWRSDCIAVGTYHPDLHGRRDPKDFEGRLKDSIRHKPNTWREGPFPIPLGALLPRYHDGIIAAEKNISFSRIAAGAARVHPTVVAIGEAAGVLAALAVHNNVQPRQVPVAAVQYELASGGALITPLYVRGLKTSGPLFAAVTLAIARGRAAYKVARPSGREPYITCDLVAAQAAGRVSIQHLSRWFGWRDRQDVPGPSVVGTEG